MKTACNKSYDCCILGGVGMDECDYRKNKKPRWTCDYMDQIGYCENPRAYPENQALSCLSEEEI